MFSFHRNETSLVSLRMLNSNGRKVLNAAFNMPYTLRAEISKSDGNYHCITNSSQYFSLMSVRHVTCIFLIFLSGTHGIRMKNCFAFNMRNNTADLLDKRG